jgi:hypothetical protein
VTLRIAVTAPCNTALQADSHLLVLASQILVLAVPLEEVSKLLGHETIKTTERHYAKWVQRAAQLACEIAVSSWIAVCR